MRGCRFLLLMSTCLAAVLAPGSALAARQPYDRYQTIVDRQMFGPLPDGFDPTKLPSEATKSSKKDAAELSKEQEKVKSAIRFSVINVTPDGRVAVGFTDSSDAKSPKHYYLRVGESRGGWMVKDADPEAATMTIMRLDDSVEVSLSIGGDSAKDASATAKAKAANAAAAPAANGPRPSRLLGGRFGGRQPSKRELSAGLVKTAEELEQIRREREAEREAREAERAEAEARRQRETQELRSQLMAISSQVREERTAREAAEAAKAADNAEKEGDGDANDDAE